MAFIQADIKIPSLYRTLPVSLYFPTDLPPSVGNKIKGVITLLHGMGNAGSDWMNMSAAPRYAADNGYVLVAPNAENSFYTDMRYGTPFYTLISQELPAQLRAIFNLPTEREQNFIAGLSMGGYGALRIGLSKPEQYAAIGSFSGAVDVQWMAATAKQIPELRAFYEPILGEDLHVGENADLFALSKNLSALPKQQQPRIYCSCGLQDNDDSQILSQNHRFRDHACSLPLSYTYAEWTGVHEWNFWDRSLAEFIGFIQNDDYAQRKSADWSAKNEQSTPL